MVHHLRHVSVRTGWEASCQAIARCCARWRVRRPDRFGAHVERRERGIVLLESEIDDRLRGFAQRQLYFTCCTMPTTSTSQSAQKSVVLTKRILSWPDPSASA